MVDSGPGPRIFGLRVRVIRTWFRNYSTRWGPVLICPLGVKCAWLFKGSRYRYLYSLCLEPKGFPELLLWFYICTYTLWIIHSRKGPSIQELSTWDCGKNKSSIGFGEVHKSQVLGGTGSSYLGGSVLGVFLPKRSVYPYTSSESSCMRPA